MGKKASKEVREAVGKQKFSQEEMKGLRKLFDSFNKKGDELNRNEFRLLLKHCTGIQDLDSLGVDVDEIFDFVDASKNGSVSFQEFLFWLAIYKKGNMDEKLAHIFEVFDEDRKGHLNTNQVARLKDVLILSLKNKGEDSSAADKLIATIDENSDGIITKEEWAKNGAAANIVEILLGSEFIQLMKQFQF